MKLSAKHLSTTKIVKFDLSRMGEDGRCGELSREAAQQVK